MPDLDDLTAYEVKPLTPETFPAWLALAPEDFSAAFRRLPAESLLPFAPSRS